MCCVRTHKTCALEISGNQQYCKLQVETQGKVLKILVSDLRGAG